MEAWAIELLKNYGLAGLVIAVLAWAYQRERKEKDAIQERRILETQTITRALDANTAATLASTQQYHSLELILRGALK